MEKMRELTIADVKELTMRKRIKAHLVSAMLIEPMDAIVTAMPNSGEDGTINVLFADGIEMKLDAGKEIEAVRGNESEIEIEFPNTMGFLYVSIVGDFDTEEDPVINHDELCKYIKNRLDRLSKLTVEDINTILDMEMEYMKSKGVVD